METNLVVVSKITRTRYTTCYDDAYRGTQDYFRNISSRYLAGHMLLTTGFMWMLLRCPHSRGSYSAKSKISCTIQMDVMVALEGLVAHLLAEPCLI